MTTSDEWKEKWMAEVAMRSKRRAANTRRFRPNYCRGGLVYFKDTSISDGYRSSNDGFSIRLDEFSWRQIRKISNEIALILNRASKKKYSSKCSQ